MPFTVQSTHTLAAASNEVITGGVVGGVANVDGRVGVNPDIYFLIESLLFGSETVEQVKGKKLQPPTYCA